MQMQGSFNAQQFQPNQGGSAIHPPVLKIPFEITGTEIKANNAGTGGYLEVLLTSQLGTQVARYNIWYKGENEAKTVEIAHGQLSALCHATGRYQIVWENEGAALRGGKGLMDIGYQRGHEPTNEKPNGGYTELKKVYDLAGNEPGKSGQPAPQQAQQPAQQGGANWQQGQPQAQPQPSQPPAGWNGAAQPQPQPQAAQQAPQGQAWQPGGAAPASNPPWRNRT